MKPLPGSPSRFSFGTRQSSKMTVEVSLARSPSLFSFFPGEESRHSFFENECGDSVMTGGFVGDGHRDTDVAIRPMGREVSARSEPNRLPSSRRDRLRAARIAAGFGFRQTPRADLFALRQRHDETATLIFVAGLKMCPVHSEL